MSRGVGGEKSIRLVVGRFLRGQEVGLPRVYAANVRSICTVVRRDGRGSFDSLRGDAPTRRFLVLIPRDGNRCVPLAHCYGNERSRRYLPILDRPLQIVFLIATRVLFARLPGNVIYQIVRDEIRNPCFRQQTPPSLPPRSRTPLFRNWNRIESRSAIILFLILVLGLVLKIVSRCKTAKSKTIEFRFPFAIKP